MARKKKSVEEPVITDMTAQEQAPVIPQPAPILSPEELDAARAEATALESSAELPETTVSAEAKPMPNLTAQAVPLNDGINPPAQQDETLENNPQLTPDTTIQGSVPAARPLLTQEQMDAARQQAQQPAEQATATVQTAEAPTGAIGTAASETGSTEQEDNELTPTEQAQLDAITNAYKDREMSLLDILEKTRADYEAEQARSLAEAKAERQRAIWGGATEMASAIANLIGTANGATNQQYKLQTPSWMREAETQRNMRRQRLDAFRKQQREAENALNSIKGQGDLARVQEWNKIMQQHETQRRNDAYTAYQTARTEGEYLKQELNQAKLQLEKDKNTIREAESEAKVKEIESRIKKNESQTAKNYAALQGLKDKDKKDSSTTTSTTTSAGENAGGSFASVFGK